MERRVNIERNSEPPLRCSSYICTYGKEHKWQSGHLYIVKPWVDREVYKLGITTHLDKRMYWYPVGVELLFCILTKSNLKLIEQLWIRKIKNDGRFIIVQGREYFIGPVTVAINILHEVIEFVGDDKISQCRKSITI